MLGSVTLTWYQVLVVAAAAVCFYALELWLFLRAARRQAEHDAAGQARIDVLDAQVAALRERVAELSADVSTGRRMSWSSERYREAVDMAQQGQDAAVVADNCGISRAEAELIVALHRSQAT